jgi:hypothetical protein
VLYILAGALGVSALFIVVLIIERRRERRVRPVGGGGDTSDAGEDSKGPWYAAEQAGTEHAKEPTIPAYLMPRTAPTYIGKPPPAVQAPAFKQFSRVVSRRIHGANEYKVTAADSGETAPEAAKRLWGQAGGTAKLGRSLADLHASAKARPPPPPKWVMGEGLGKMGGGEGVWGGRGEDSVY